MRRAKFVVGIVSLHDNVLKQEIVTVAGGEAEALVAVVGDAYKGKTVDEIKAAAFDADYIVGALEIPA